MRRCLRRGLLFSVRSHKKDFYWTTCSLPLQVHQLHICFVIKNSLIHSNAEWNNNEFKIQKQTTLTLSIRQYNNTKYIFYKIRFFSYLTKFIVFYTNIIQIIIVTYVQTCHNKTITKHRYKQNAKIRFYRISLCQFFNWIISVLKIQRARVLFRCNVARDMWILNAGCTCL